MGFTLQLVHVMMLSGQTRSATHVQVDYLVTPRVAACMIAGPFLNVLCFTMGAAGSLRIVVRCRCALLSPVAICDLSGCCELWPL